MFPAISEAKHSLATTTNDSSVWETPIFYLIPLLDLKGYSQFMGSFKWNMMKPVQLGSRKVSRDNSFNQGTPGVLIPGAWKRKIDARCKREKFLTTFSPLKLDCGVFTKSHDLRSIPGPSGWKWWRASTMTRHESSWDVGCRFTQRTNIRNHLGGNGWNGWCVLTCFFFQLSN